MSKHFFLFAALVLSTSGLTAQSVNDERELQAFARRFMAAYNAQDHAALQQMYTADAVRIDQQGNEIKGAGNIAAYFESQFIKSDGTLLLKQMSVHWSDKEHAFVASGAYEIYGVTYVYDIPIQNAGTYTNSMLKQNGQWKIAKSVLAPPAQVDSPTENAGIIDGLYQSFANGDIPAVVAVMDKNIIWNEAENFPYADRNPYVGPQAVLDGVFARIGVEWEYWNLTGIQLHNMANNQVLATLRYQAKHKKTGRVLDAQTAHLWTLKDGSVIAFQQFTDTKQVADVVGKTRSSTASKARK